MEWMRLFFEKQYRFTIKEIPDEFEKYPGWRYRTMLRVRRCGLPVKKVELYFASINLRSFEDLEDQSDLDEAFLQLDNNVHDALVDAMTGKFLSKKIPTMERQVKAGNGRRAMKLIDKLMRYEGHILARKAYKNLVKRECATINDIEAYTDGIEEDRFIAATWGQPVADDMIAGFVTDAISPNAENSKNKEVAPIFAEWEARRNRNDPTADLDDLILQLQNFCATRNARKQEERKSGRAGVSSSQKGEYDEKGGCAHCHMKNHPKSKCFKLHPNLRPGYDSSAAGYAGKEKGGKGRGRGGKDDRSSTRDREKEKEKEKEKGRPEPKKKCDHCGRTNHESEKCRFKPVDGRPSGHAGVVTSSSSSSSSSSSPNAPWDPENSAGTAELDEADEAFMSFVSAAAKKTAARGSGRAVTRTVGGLVRAATLSVLFFLSIVHQGFSASVSNTTKAYAAWMIDSGASDHIVDRVAAADAGATFEKADVWMDTVGGERHVTDTVCAKIPYISGHAKALAIPNAANCASMGKIVYGHRSRFTFDCDEGAWLEDKKTGKTLVTFDVVDNVPYFPRRRDPREHGRYARRGTRRRFGS